LRCDVAWPEASEVSVRRYVAGAGWGSIFALPVVVEYFLFTFRDASGGALLVYENAQGVWAVRFE